MTTTWLKAGKLAILLDNNTLRYVQHNGVEIVRGIYAAVRDKNWDTVIAKVDIVKLEEKSKSFYVHFKCFYSQADIQFVADLIFEGNENGQIVCSFTGVALSRFQTNRIGFCMLHPLKECAGQNVTINETEKAVFPKLVSPHQPFFNVQAMHWNPSEKIEVKIVLEGDIFETEDQRNWSDASFKTYCTPLANLYPRWIEAGETVSQKINLRVEIKHDSDSQAPCFTASFPKFVKEIPFVSLGLGISTHDDNLNHFHIQQLSALKIDHLKADIYLFKPEWKQKMERAIVQTQQTNTKLECILHFSEAIEHEASAFLDFVQNKIIFFHSILLLPYRKTGLPQATQNQWIALFKNHLPAAPIGIGTDAHFADLNMSNCDVSVADFLSFPLYPQVHAFDDLTLIENIEAQADMVKSAKILSEGKPIHVHAITLKRRFSADSDLDQKPESDERQMTPFCAEWTQASIQTLALAGADSLTYYETTGSRGVMNAMEVYPVYASILHAQKRIKDCMLF